MGGSFWSTGYTITTDNTTWASSNTVQVWPSSSTPAPAPAKPKTALEKLDARIDAVRELVSS